MNTKRLVTAVLIVGLFYGGAYVGFRQTHIEVWAKNGRPYVIFPTGSLGLYYFFRPLSYVDGRISGMGFHIGPHRE